MKITLTLETDFGKFTCSDNKPPLGSVATEVFARQDKLQESLAKAFIGSCTGLHQFRLTGINVENF